MSACEAYIDLIMRSIDGQTDGQEEVKLQVHLASCAGCKALYDAYLSVDDSIRDTKEVPPKELKNAIMNRIGGEKVHFNPKSWMRRGRFTMIAAVAAILLLVFSRYGGNLIRQASVSSETKAAQTEEAAEEPQTAQTELPQAEFRSGNATQAANAPEEAAADDETADVEQQPDTDTATGTADANQVQEVPTGSSLEQALADAGCQAETLMVTDLSEEELLTLLPDASSVTMDNGKTAYVASRDTVDGLINSGEISVAERYTPDDEQDSLDYWIVLND